jgi:hypothetical protein
MLTVPSLIPSDAAHACDADSLAASNDSLSAYWVSSYCHDPWLKLTAWKSTAPAGHDLFRPSVLYPDGLGLFIKPTQ